jgi:hypothetical protein
MVQRPLWLKERIVKKSSLLVSFSALVVLSGAVSSVAVADEAAAPAAPVKGSMLVASNGARLAPVYKVGPDGSAQIILEGKMVTVPAATLSMAGGHLTTSLTKNEVLALH